MRPETLKTCKRLCDYLVSTLADWDGQPENFKKMLEPVLNMTADRIGRYISGLKTDGRVADILTINPYETRFRHQFYVGLKLDLFKMREIAPDKKPGAEWFIEKLIEDAKEKKEIRKHLVIVEGVTVHGPTDRDVELTLFTSDGVSGVYRWIRDDLTHNYSFIKDITTASVSYSHRWRGYAGQPIRLLKVEDDES